MNIVLATGIYPPEIGGPAGYVNSLARELHRRGHRPVVVTYGGERTKTGEGWPVIAVPRTGGPFLRYLRYAFYVWKEARAADVVFLQGPVSDGFPGTIGAMLARRPTIMKVVGDYAWEMYQQTATGNVELLDEFVMHRHSGSIRVLEFLERWTARSARRVITPSQYLHGIVRTWGVLEERIQVIVNSISPLPSTPTREELRQSFRVEPFRVILTAVRAVPWKGVDFLLDLLPRLPEDSLLVVAGDGPMLDAWKSQAAAKDLSRRVRFLGRVDRATLAQWYVAADMFALATGYEGYPHVVAEAVSTGLPCVVSDRGGNPETKISFPEHVKVVAYRDADAWVAALSHRVPRGPSVLSRTFGRVVDETLAVLEASV